jgi:hypothetical protein
MKRRRLCSAFPFLTQDSESALRHRNGWAAPAAGQHGYYQQQHGAFILENGAVELPASSLHHQYRYRQTEPGVKICCIAGEAAWTRLIARRLKYDFMKLLHLWRHANRLTA